MAKKPVNTKHKTKARTVKRAVPLSAPKRASAVWSIQDGKDSFSALVEAARQKPQTVTKHGKPAVVVVAKEEFDRMAGMEGKPTKNFVEHLLDMPQGGEDFERLPFEMRDIDF